MEITILATKTGQMNMGGYFKEKTAQVFTIEDGTYFRFKYVNDSCDECFDTIEQAMNKFNKASKMLN
jgi:hypothetical protein